MNNNLIIFGFVFGLIIVSLLIGFIGLRKTNTTQAFLGGTKMFGPFMVALSSLAAMASGNAVVGVPAAIYAGNNIMSYWMLSSCIFAMAYFIIGKRVRAMAEVGTISTLGDICDLRFNSRGIKAISSITLFLGCVAYLSAQIVAGSSLFTYLLGWDIMPAALLIFGIVTLYVIISGEVGGIMTQAFQGFIIFLAGFIIIGGFFFIVGGFENVLNVCATAGTVVNNGVEKVFTPDLVGAYGTVGSSAILAAFFIPILGTMGQPQVITRMYALKSPHDLPKMGIYAGLMHLVISLMSICIAFSALYLVGGGKIAALASIDSAAWAVGEYFGLFAQIVIYSAVMAAIISSSSMYLLSSANFISKDLLSSLGFKFNDKKQLMVTRIAVGIIGIAAILFAVSSKEGTAMLTTFGWGTLMSATFPVFITGLLWKKANKKGVYAGVITALAGNILCFILLRIGFKFPGGFPWYVLVITVAIVVTILISLVTYDEKKDKLSPKMQAAMNL